MTEEQLKDFMGLALMEAEKAAQKGEVPIGAVLTKDGKVLAKAHNLKESTPVATHHAEILVIEQASRRLGRWRLTDCELFVSLEPCLMCAGAIIQARIPKLYYGAKDSKFGAVESLYTCLTDHRANHQVEVAGGLLAEESSTLLKKFFKDRRR